MGDKLMYISNNEIQNYPFYILKLVVKTFELYWTNQLKFNKVSKLVNQQQRKRYYKTLGTSV